MRHALVCFPRPITQLMLEWQYFCHIFGRLRNLFPAWMKGTLILHFCGSQAKFLLQYLCIFLVINYHVFQTKRDQQRGPGDSVQMINDNSWNRQACSKVNK
jgi:hypothetical protein